MLDTHIQKIAAPTLEVFAKRLKGMGISADHITFAGFGCGLFASFLIALGKYNEGLAFIVLNRLADGLDGARARLEDEISRRGGFLDIVFDFIFYASIPLAFAIADPRGNALVAAFVLFSFIGTGSSFLAYAIAEKGGGIKKERVEAKDGDGKVLHPIVKAFFYIGGVTEATETVIFFVLACLLPQWFWLLGIVFTGLCLATTGTRVWRGWNDLAG